jgi:hypothetical protein
MKRQPHPQMCAGKLQKKVDVPRVMRLLRRWMREHADKPGAARVFYLWVHRGYHDTESMFITTKWAVRDGDHLAALIATLVLGMSSTQRSKIVGSRVVQSLMHFPGGYYRSLEDTLGCG